MFKDHPTPSQPAKPRKGAPLWMLAKWLLVALMGATFLLILALIVARITLSDERLTRLLEDGLNEQLQGRFEIEQVRWRWPNAVLLQGAVVYGPGNESVMEITEMQAELALTPLLSRTILITSASIDGAAITYETNGDTPPEMIGAFLPTVEATADEQDMPTAFPWRITVQSLAITNSSGVVRIDDDLIVRAPSLEARGSIDWYREILSASIDSEIPTLHVSLPSEEFDFPALSVTLQRGALTLGPNTDTRISAALLKIQTPGNAMTLSGNLALPENMPTDLLVGTDTAHFDIQSSMQLDFEQPALRQALEEVAEGILPKDGKLNVMLHATSSARQGITLAGEALGDALQIAAVPMDSLSFKIHFHHPTLQVDQLRLHLKDGSSVHASGSYELHTHAHDVHVQAQRLAARELATRLLAALAPELASIAANAPNQLSAKMHAHGPNLMRRQSSIELAASMHGLPEKIPAAFFAPELPLELNVALDIDGEDINISDGTATLGQNTATFLGRLSLAEGMPMQASMQLRNPNPTATFAALDLPIAAQALQLKATMQGPLAQATIHGQLSLQALHADPLPAAEISVPFALQLNERLDRAPKITINHAQAHIAAGIITANGHINLPQNGTPLQFDMRLHGQGLELTSLSADAAAGTLTLTAQVSGRPDEPQVAGDISIEALRLGDTDFPRAEAQLHTDGPIITLSPLRLQVGATGMVRGRATLNTATAHVSAVIESNAILMDDLRHALPNIVEPSILEAIDSWQAAGTVQATILVEGTAKDMNYRSTMVVQDLQLRQQNLGRLEVWGWGNLQTMFLTTHSIGPHGSLRFDVAHSFNDNSVHGEVRGHRLSVPRIAELLGVPTDIVSGSATLALDIGGHLPYPDLKGELRVVNLQAVDQAVAPEDVVLSMVSEPVHPQHAPKTYALALTFGRGTQVAARIHSAPELRVEATGELDDFALHSWLPALQAANYQLYTSSTFNVDYSPSTGVTGSATIADLEVMTPMDTLRIVRPATLQILPEGFSLDELVARGRLSSIELRGHYLEESISVLARGRFDTALLTPWIPAITQSSGVVDLNGQIKGTKDAPEVLADLSFASPVRLRPRYVNRDMLLEGGNVRLSNQQVTIQELTGRFGPGRFALGGTITLDDFMPDAINLTLDSEAVEFATGDLLLEANSALALTGAFARPTLSGRIELVRGRYLKEFELRNFNFIAREVDTDLPLAQRLPWLGRLQLDLHALTTGPMEIRVDASALAMEMDLETDVRVTGLASAPSIDGQVLARRGTIQFPHANMELVRATVDFLPARAGSVGAEIDLQAEGDITPRSAEFGSMLNYLITLGIRGDLQELSLELQSDPPLAELEILTLLVTGRVSLPELAGTSAEERGQLDAALLFAGSQLASPLSRFVERQLEQTLNLELELDAAITSEAALITAGRTFTQRIRLEGALQRGLGDTRSLARARATLSLSDRLYLQGETATGFGAETASSARDIDRTRLELRLRFFGEQ